MKTFITGHRLYKLQSYDIQWIQEAILDALEHTFLNHTSVGFSGMARVVSIYGSVKLFNASRSPTLLVSRSKSRKTLLQRKNRKSSAEIVYQMPKKFGTFETVKL